MGNSSWNHDHKMDKKQHARDILGVRTSSRYKHEDRKAAEDARIANRRDRRAAKQAEGSSLCSAILLASSLSAAGLASVIARAKGWAA